MRITRDPSETVVARIVTLVDEASATKAETQMLVEKIKRRYSVAVVAATLALLTFPLLFGADLQSTLLRAMTFMIVASPCAMILATMPPLLSAIANAGRHGVLVKSAVGMENLAEITVVALDKTGTLTTGRLELTGVVPLGISRISPDEILKLAAAAEAGSEHPLGSAIVTAARDRGLDIAVAEDFRALPGRGVHAKVGDQLIAVTSPNTAPGKQVAAVSDIEARGGTAVIVIADQEPLGVLELHDRIRPEAPSAVQEFTALTDAAPILITGDNRAAATVLGERLGITDVRAELLPDQKAAAVTQLQAIGQRVLVVGDGVNDAPAMAAANASVAMGSSGADLSLETADAVSVRDDLAAISNVIALARRARRVVIANLIIAASFITALVVWDLVGYLPLPLGVAGHEGSTILVAVNGLRLLSESAWRRAAPRRQRSQLKR